MRRSIPLFACLLALAPAGMLMSGPRADLSEADRRRVEEVTRPAEDFSDAERYEAMQAGATTSIAEPDRRAFSHFSANLPREEEMRFRLGNALFRKLWVAAPSSTQASDGLGPLYNARSCEACHREDGRGRPPEGRFDHTSMFLKLARAPRTEEERALLAQGTVQTLPDPVYGRQLQDRAIAGAKAEGRMAIAYESQIFAYPDGTKVELRKPVYGVEGLAFGPLHPDTALSPRMAPAMIGLGLIEAISDDDIRAHADPDDEDGDGISGRVQQVRTLTGEAAIGRFGWKAENATVRDQAAHALVNDIGISTPLLPFPYGDCTDAQIECRKMPHGDQARLGGSEAPDPVLPLIEFYSRHLAVPARRKASFPDVLEGKRLFYAAGCISCHVPKYVTRRDWPDKAHRFQLIWPYSDFLLHDMGEGLADGQAVGAASGREWKTPPLWGIGLTATVTGEAFYLHDGRARSLEEAILWHGGEAARARDNFAAFSAEDRAKLIGFLESL